MDDTGGSCCSSIVARITISIIIIIVVVVLRLYYYRIIIVLELFYSYCMYYYYCIFVVTRFGNGIPSADTEVLGSVVWLEAWCDSKADRGALRHWQGWTPPAAACDWLACSGGVTCCLSNGTSVAFVRVRCASVRG